MKVIMMEIKVKEIEELEKEWDLLIPKEDNN